MGEAVLAKNLILDQEEWMEKEKIKQELFRWYDKEYLWKWEYVLDFVLHILALRGKKIEKRTQPYLHADEPWDRHFRQQERIERMLKWIIIFSYNNQPRYCEGIKEKLPNISDIIETGGKDAKL